MRLLTIILLLFSFVGFSQTTTTYKGQPVYYKGQLLGKVGEQQPNPPTCNDGIQNGDETGIDCGGSFCEPCGGLVATIAVSPTSGAESIGIVQWTVSLNETNATGSGLTVNYSVSGSATPDIDFSNPSGNVVVSNGSSTATISIPIIDDSDTESNETITLTVQVGPGYQVGQPSSATFVINDNDIAPGGSGDEVYVVATDPTATKSPTVTTGTFTITSVEAVTSDTDINYNLTGNAVNGTDYQTLSGVATIPSGQTSVTVTVTPINTDVIESRLAVILEITAGSGYSLPKTYGLRRSDNIIITNNKNENLPTTTGTSTITSLADFTNPANAGTRATVTGSFNATGATAAANMVLVAGGGIISGTNINLNGSGIEDGTTQLFAEDYNFSFNTPYELSRLRPEIFGAAGNGVTEDKIAIVNLMKNVVHATGTNGATYVHNDDCQGSSHPNAVTRSGTFDWDMNGSVLAVTNASGLSTGNLDSTFDISNLDIQIYNGEFDGNDLGWNLFYFRDPKSIFFQDLFIHNYRRSRSEVNNSTNAIKSNVYSQFTEAYFIDCDIRDIDGVSIGTANVGGAGTAKAFWFDTYTNDSAEIWIQDTYVDGIRGDDAEGIYIKATSATYNTSASQVFFHLENNSWLRCERRAAKLNDSNVSFWNNFVESVTTDWRYTGQQGAIVHLFPINPQTPLVNMQVVGNRIRTVGSARNNGLGVTETTNSLIEGNLFEASSILLQRSIIFGNGSNIAGSNSGYIDGTLTFTNNTITNYFILFDGFLIAPSTTFVMENNTINIEIDRGVGASWGVFRRPVPNYMDINNITIRDLTININQTISTGSLFSVLMTEASDLTNTTWDNITVNYTGTAPTPTYPFMRIGSNPGVSMDATNTIIDCTINGDVGTAAIGYTGSFGATITNSTGDGATPITAVSQ